jgi:hypothetical protein
VELKEGRGWRSFGIIPRKRRSFGVRIVRFGRAHPHNLSATNTAARTTLRLVLKTMCYRVLDSLHLLRLSGITLPEHAGRALLYAAIAKSIKNIVQGVEMGRSRVLCAIDCIPPRGNNSLATAVMTAWRSPRSRSSRRRCAC